MAGLALGATVFFAIALIARELQVGHERAANLAMVEQLRLALEGTRVQLRRAAEDLFVLQNVLVERHVIDDSELSRSRTRLIDTPRRAAEERDAIHRHLGVQQTQIVMDEGDDKIH